MVLERVQHGCSVPLIDDRKTVEEFAADRADEALGDRVGSRRLYRCLDDSDVHVGEDGVEGGGELGVAFADEPSFVLKVYEQVACLLGEPSWSWVEGAACSVR
jgi:hypothetical protein